MLSAFTDLRRFFPWTFSFPSWTSFYFLAYQSSMSWPLTVSYVICYWPFCPDTGVIIFWVAFWNPVFSTHSSNRVPLSKTLECSYSTGFHCFLLNWWLCLSGSKAIACRSHRIGPIAERQNRVSCVASRQYRGPCVAFWHPCSSRNLAWDVALSSPSSSCRTGTLQSTVSHVWMSTKTWLCSWSHCTGKRATPSSAWN